MELNTIIPTALLAYFLIGIIIMRLRRIWTWKHIKEGAADVTAIAGPLWLAEAITAGALLLFWPLAVYANIKYHREVKNGTTR